MKESDAMHGETHYPEVDRRAGLSLKDFKSYYRAPKKPVVITDAIDGWGARTGWTFDFFRKRYGKTLVNVHEYHGERYRPNDIRWMELADYIEGVLSKDWVSFPYYIRDNWRLLVEHPELSADYSFPPYFFDWFKRLPPFMQLPYPRIFIGPKGAVTPLHMDIWRTHAWLSQLVGRKRWILFPPEQSDLLYDYQVDPERPDLKRFPLYRHARPVECTIGPGDTIFVPTGWAHWVVSMDPTISLTSNYMGPGCFWPALSNSVRELVLKRAWETSTRWVSRGVPGARPAA
jgi:histone arginine demethylase JMJD6